MCISNAAVAIQDHTWWFFRQHLRSDRVEVDKVVSRAWSAVLEWRAGCYVMRRKCSANSERTAA